MAIPLDDVHDKYGRCDRCGHENVPVTYHGYGRHARLHTCLVCTSLPNLDGNLPAALAHCTLLILEAIHNGTTTLRME